MSCEFLKRMSDWRNLALLHHKLLRSLTAKAAKPTKRMTSVSCSFKCQHIHQGKIPMATVLGWAIRKPKKMPRDCRAHTSMPIFEATFLFASLAI